MKRSTFLAVVFCLVGSGVAEGQGVPIEPIWLDFDCPPGTRGCRMVYTLNGDSILGGTIDFAAGQSFHGVVGDIEANDQRHEFQAASGSTIPITGRITLPNGQVDDLFNFFLTHGHTSGGSAFALPALIGDQNANGQLDNGDESVFALITNINQFDSVAHVANFPDGSVFFTDANGRVAGLPGVMFFRDNTHTTSYANAQLLTVVTLSEFALVPQPSSIVLLGLGLFLGLIARVSIGRGERVSGPAPTSNTSG